MRNKKIGIVFSATLFIVILILAGYRYYDLNRDYPEHTVVKEKILPINKEVKKRHIEYKVLDIKVNEKKPGREVGIDVFLYVKLLAPNLYGYHKNSLNASENMYVYSPYLDPAPTELFVYDENRKKVHLNFEINKPTKFWLHFDIPKDEYNLKKGETRFSFLIPEKEKSFTKYSTYIPY